MNVDMISRTWSHALRAFRRHCIFILLWSNQQNWQSRALDLSLTPLWWSVKTIFYFSTQSIAVQMFRFFLHLMFHSLHLLSSSLLSPQSSAPSHTQRLGMQRWFAHSNWAAEQNSSGQSEDKTGFYNPPQKRVWLCCTGACLGLSMLTYHSEPHLRRSHSHSPYRMSSSWVCNAHWDRQKRVSDTLFCCFL